MSPPAPPPTPPTHADYLRAVTAALGNRDNRLDRKYSQPRWRDGQTYFNVLYAGRPDLADAVRGTDLDPFHRDDRVPAFLRWVARNWDGPGDD